ncbi:MAG: histidine--tRNA ligase [Gemmatimonadetes bacterium]|nr:histidine--tRNA ligase [Gemmatimonadota bacterium]
MPATALPGFREFYPDDAALRNHIFSAWRTVAARYGFEEYDGPPLEPLELYTDKSGAEIMGQLYYFEDKGGRSVALRPEMTPTLARMVGARASSMMKPIRWFSMPQLFRYERPQRGRLREHFQLNMDLIGETSPLADAEIIAAALDVQRVLGLTEQQVCVRLSHRGVIQQLLLNKGVPADRLSATLTAIDRLEVDAPEALEWARKQLVQLGVGGELAEGVLEVARIRDWTTLERAAGAVTAGGPVENLLACRDALFQMGLEAFVQLDTSIVRGLAYYTGVVFELFDRQHTLRAICGGGRYDDLVKQVSGTDVPCVGFGMGDAVLTELLKESKLVPVVPSRVQAFLVAHSAANQVEVLRLAHMLRDEGVSVEYAMKIPNLRRQFEQAGKRQARYVVIVGSPEGADAVVKIRDLASGHEEVVAQGALAARVRS